MAACGAESKRTGDETDARRPLRICFISSQVYGLFHPSSGLPVGGAEVQIASLARELSRDPQFEIVILTGDGTRSAREREGAITVVLDPLYAAPRAYRQDGTHASAAEARGLTMWERMKERGQRYVRQCPSPLATAMRAVVRGGYACRRWAKSVPPVLAVLQKIREGRRAFRWFRLFRSIRADVYVTRCASAQVKNMQTACSLLRRPFVYMVAHEMDVSGEYTRANPTAGKLFEEGLRRADAIVCQHGGQAELLRARYARDAQVVRSICPSPVRSGAAESKKAILWIARSDSWKQPELFMDLVGRLPNESFVMVSPLSQMEPEILSGLKARAERMANLRFMERVPFGETAALFDEAKVFVNTSKWEGFPNTFLQAAACGTPIVSWAVNPDDVLDRYHFGLCAHGDTARLEELVRLVCADDALRAELGRQGQRYVREHHDPAVVAGQFADLCRSLTCGHAASRGRSCGSVHEVRGSLTVQ
ncbi:MAG: glycosyltransferase family 4 protein [Nitrospiraceae bacterium]